MPSVDGSRTDRGRTFHQTVEITLDGRVNASSAQRVEHSDTKSAECSPLSNNLYLWNPLFSRQTAKQQSFISNTRALNLTLA
jgi:hypothetical protein